MANTQLLLQILIPGAAALHSLFHGEEIPVVLILRFRKAFNAVREFERVLSHAITTGHQREGFDIRERIEVGAHAGKQFLNILSNAVAREWPPTISGSRIVRSVKGIETTDPINRIDIQILL